MTLLVVLNPLRARIPVPIAAAGAPVRPRAERVFLPPPAARSATPAPPRRAGKDKISIGAPDPRQARELMLRRDQDISSRPSAPGSPVATASSAAKAPAGAPERSETGGGLTLPGRNGELASGTSAAPAATRRPSILGSLEGIERRLQDAKGADGLTSGATGQQMGALFFDPQGADFTAWINHFKNEVYRNWLIPQSVMLGYQGQVEISFTVGRDGTMTDVAVLSSSGHAALDRAAVNALVGSRLRPLPSDYAPAEVTMKVLFLYNSGRRAS